MIRAKFRALKDKQVQRNMVTKVMRPQCEDRDEMKKFFKKKHDRFHWNCQEDSARFILPHPKSRKTSDDYH